jgi:hypothetical protein
MVNEWAGTQGMKLQQRLFAHPTMGALVVWSIDTAASDPYEAAIEALLAIVGDVDTAAELMLAGFALNFDVYDHDGKMIRIDLAREKEDQP